MDQHLQTTLTAPAPPNPSSAMSSTAPEQAMPPVSPTPPNPPAPPKPAAPAAAQSPVADSPAADSPVADSPAEDAAKPATLRQQPIPPASEPMQYRAIGLVRGRYEASEEQFTKGNIITENGTAVDAVLLGRVMSLVKKHIDLEQSHLWVVYPRTRENVEGLHVQIVGVWEPEKLNRPDSSDAEDAEAVPSDAEPSPEPEELDEPDDKYFSVRGEVVFQSPEDQKLLVKIRRSPQQGSDESKIFKVAIQGVLEGKVVGYFWDLQVERQDNNLILREGTRIGLVPPQKRAPGAKGGPRRGGPPRRGGFNGPRREGGAPQRPVRAGDRQGDRSAPPSQPRQFTKPVKRAKENQPES